MRLRVPVAPRENICSNSCVSSSTVCLHLEAYEPERRAVVEQHHENHPPGDVGEIHRLLLALVEQRAEVVLADQLRQLVVGAEVGGGERGEGGGVEVRRLADRGDELAGAVDEQSAARVGTRRETGPARVVIAPKSSSVNDQLAAPTGIAMSV